MAFQFKRAIREQAGLLIGLAGGTGSGKTFSALRLAAGISGDKPFAVIDTEAGRALHYADQFRFDHGDLHAPFTSQAYTEAILAADSAKYPCIVVDSCSHEWSGEGGVLEMQEAELDRMAGENWQKREACKMAAWIKPKMAHKKMVQRLLQVRAHLILCFRAEEKVEMQRDDKGKMQIVPRITKTGLDGWVPICEKAFPFELTASFLLTNDAPGVPKPIKLEAQHRIMFPLDKPITEESGRLVRSWAEGGASVAPPPIAEIKPAAVKPSAPYDIDALVKSLTVVKSLSQLATAFEIAWKTTKGDKAARAQVKAKYDDVKANLENEAAKAAAIQAAEFTDATS